MTTDELNESLLRRMMENTKKAKKKFPDCPVAVGYHELSEIRVLWELAKSHKFTPIYTVHLLCQQADFALSIMPGGLLSKVRPQMDAPGFLKYVEEKLKND